MFEKNYSLLVSQFSLIDSKNISEDDSSIVFRDKDLILKALKIPSKLRTTPEEFEASLKKSNHPLMLTQYPVEELSKMQLFKVKGFSIGYALKNVEGVVGKEIVAVHNNTGIRGLGDALMSSAIQNGGRYLDHFDGELSNIYGRNGFIEYKRDEYNPDYDEGGMFAKTYGKRPVVYRRHISTSAP